MSKNKLIEGGLETEPTPKYHLMFRKIINRNYAYDLPVVSACKLPLPNWRLEGESMHPHLADYALVNVLNHYCAMKSQAFDDSFDSAATESIKIGDSLAMRIITGSIVLSVACVLGNFFFTDWWLASSAFSLAPLKTAILLALAAIVAIVVSNRLRSTTTHGSLTTLTAMVVFLAGILGYASADRMLAVTFGNPGSSGNRVRPDQSHL